MCEPGFSSAGLQKNEYLGCSSIQASEVSASLKYSVRWNMNSINPIKSVMMFYVYVRIYAGVYKQTVQNTLEL